MHTGSRSWFSLSVLFIFIYFSFHQRTNFYFSANHKYWSAEYQILLSFSPLLFSNAQTFNTKSYENTSTVKTFIIIQCWFIYWEAVLISLDLSVQCVCVCVCVCVPAARRCSVCSVCVCCTVHTESVCWTAPRGGMSALLHTLRDKQETRCDLWPLISLGITLIFKSLQIDFCDFRHLKQNYNILYLWGCWCCYKAASVIHCVCVCACVCVCVCVLPRTQPVRSELIVFRTSVSSAATITSDPGTAWNLPRTAARTHARTHTHTHTLQI